MIRRPPRSTLFPYTTSSDLLGQPSLRRRQPRAWYSGGRQSHRVPSGLPPPCRWRSSTLPTACRFSHEPIPSWTCRSEEHTSELQSRQYLVCRLLLEKKKQE